MCNRANASGSDMDPLLAKAEPFRNGGSTSGIMYLGNGKSYYPRAIAAAESSEIK